MYRVDKRIFNIGDPITPTNDSYQNKADFNPTIERILSEQLPPNKKADRRQGLFIFIELSDAIRFACNITNSKIYKVKSLSDTTSFHKGDMNWTEVMYKFPDNETILRQLANFYWADGCKTFKPCWEVIVNKMQVVEVIVRNEEERKRIYSDFKINASQNIERLNFYIDRLKRQ